MYQYHLGLANLNAGNDQQGRAALKRALTLKPDFQGAESRRASCWRPTRGDEACTATAFSFFTTEERRKRRVVCF